MKAAVTRGDPKNLTRATVFRARVFYDVDGLNGTREPQEVENLLSIVQMDEGFEDVERVDMRFGVGIYGELYWTSKRNGWIYAITSSVPRNKRFIFRRIAIDFNETSNSTLS